MIGSGAYGKVYKTTNRADEKIVVAIKVIDKSKIKNEIDMLEKEIDTLSSLDHPNIVKYMETYNDNKFVYLVMQYINGKTLLESLQDKPPLELATYTRKYMRQLMLAINHCH